MRNILVPVFGFALIGLLSGCNATMNEDLDENYVVTAGDIHTAPSLNNITVRGLVESATSRNIYTTLGLMTEYVHVEVGDMVYAGQILAVLDSSDLELNIAAQKTAIDQARQNSRNAISDSQRMLNEASANLANNTNMQILNAEVALSSAEANLARLRKDYEAATRDFSEGSDLQVINARSALRNTEIQRDLMERNYESSRALYVLGVISADEMRQAENDRTLIIRQYNDARISYENAVQFQERSLEQLRVSINQATTAYQNAREMLSAARVTAQQDIERLRSNVRNAELSGNLEHMEIDLQVLERQLEDATIKAPINGTITAVIAREGAVGSGLMFVVEDTDNLRIMTSFREYDIGIIEEGMEVSITSDATGNTIYTGVIKRINPAAAASASIVEFEAEIEITSVDTGLRIGTTARVSVDF